MLRYIPIIGLLLLVSACSTYTDPQGRVHVMRRDHHGLATTSQFGPCHPGNISWCGGLLDRSAIMAAHREGRLVFD